MIGQSGLVEVQGFGRKATLQKFELPAGDHQVSLLDLQGRTLESFVLSIRPGETSRCVWRRSEAGLSRVPDPEGAPCAIR